MKISFFYCNGLFILLKCYTQGNNHEEAAVEIHKLTTICIVNAIKRHIVTQILFKKKKINLINFCRVAKFNLEHRPSNNYIEILIEKELPCKTYFKKLKCNKLSGVVCHYNEIIVCNSSNNFINDCVQVEIELKNPI